MYFGYHECTAEELTMEGETVDGVKLQAGDVVSTGEIPVDCRWGSPGVCGCVSKLESPCVNVPVCWVGVFLSEIEGRAR